MAGERQATDDQLAAFSHALREVWPHGAAALGLRVGESRSYIHAIMHGKREPRRALVFALEKAVGLPAGALSHLLGYLPVGAWDVEAAIVTDPKLSKAGRRQLLAAYQRLVGEAP